MADAAAVAAEVVALEVAATPEAFDSITFVCFDSPATDVFAKAVAECVLARKP